MAQLEIVKKVKNAILYKDAKGELFVRIDNVRLSYPFVGSPSKDEDDNGNEKKNWRCVGMLPKSTHTDAKNLLKEVILDIIKKNDAKVPTSNWFLKDGDEADDENMHGHFLVSAADSKKRPKVRDERGIIMDEVDEIDQKFYGGCWAHLLIRPWYFSGKANNGKTYPKRVPANLVGVFFHKNDTPFGNGSIDDEDIWEGVKRDEDDGMDDDDSGL